jgi:predicted NBD/HSP70 family sugar kinase
VGALEHGVDALLAQLGEPRSAVRALGVGVPALVARDGRVVFGPNLGWRDVPLRARLAATWSVPVVVDNDTKAAALAERLFGAAQGARDFVLVAGHSGIGGAVHLDGRIVRGAGGFAGELGHVTVEPGGRPCGCGDRGCLEAYLSERAVEAQLRERGVVVAGYEGAAERAAAGDVAVLEVLDGAGVRLGRALADVVDLLDPECIVLAGSLARRGPVRGARGRARARRADARAPPWPLPRARLAAGARRRTDGRGGPRDGRARRGTGRLDAAGRRAGGRTGGGERVGSAS